MPTKKVYEAEAPVADVSEEDILYWRLRSPYPADYRSAAKEYFYDGEADISNGVILVPKTHPHWVQRLLNLNYVWDGETPEDWNGVR